MGFEYLKQLGKATEEVRQIGKSPLAEVARQFANTAVNEMKQDAPSASGSLAASLSFEFEESDGKLLIKFLADDYWDFVNSGVDGVNRSAGAITNQFGATYKFKTINPSPSMVEAFGGAPNYGKDGGKGSMQNWMASKNIIAKDGDYNSLAYLLARATKRDGIKPKPFIDNAISEDKLQAFEQLLLNALEEII